MRWPHPSLPSVANEGFAPLCGAAATPVAALKTPVAPKGKGESRGRIIKIFYVNKSKMGVTGTGSVTWRLVDIFDCFTVNRLAKNDWRNG